MNPTLILSDDVASLACESEKRRRKKSVPFSVGADSPPPPCKQNKVDPQLLLQSPAQSFVNTGAALVIIQPSIKAGNGRLDERVLP